MLLPAQSQARIKDIKEYDTLIEDATKRYWPDFPIPELLKAQLYQESRLDPNAVSPVGARGISQFMPKTWADVAKALGFKERDILEPRAAIPAAAYYMGTLRRSIHLREFTDPDLHKMAQASYNAGLGNIKKAIALVSAQNDAECVLSALPKITGRHAKETQTYVRRIWEYYEEIKVTQRSTDATRKSDVVADLIIEKKIERAPWYENIIDSIIDFFKRIFVA